jgi:tetratricopeptide (TPR) repeat protein
LSALVAQTDESRTKLDLVIDMVCDASVRDTVRLEAALVTLASLESEPEIAGSFEFLMARGVLQRTLAIERLAAPRTGNLTRRDLVPQKGEWSFFKGSHPAPKEWCAPGFDASSWTRGKGGFGFGDSDDLTVLDDMQGKYSTIFIRRDFDVDEGDLRRAVGLRLSLWFDDGFVAYINGKEVARLHAPGRRGTPVAHTATADSQHEAIEYEDFLVPASHLILGRNTIALQGINYTVASSDFSLDGSLVLVERKKIDRGEDVARWISGATASLERAIECGDDPEAAARAKLELAATRVVAGDVDGAIRICRSIPDSVSKSTRDSAAYVEALAHLREGRLVLAGRVLARIEELSPTIEGRHASFLMGRIHHGLGERPEAIASYERALAGAAADGWLPFPNVEIGIRRATALFELGDSERATEILAAIAKDESSPQLAAHAGLFRAIALLAGSKAQTADREFVRLARTALDSDLQARSLLWASRAVFARLEKAESWIAGELRTRSIDLLDQGRMIEPSDKIARQMRISRADALLQLGEFSEATAAYAELAKGGSNESLRAAYRRIVALQLEGRHVESIRAARDVERLHPASPNSAALALRGADSQLHQALASRSSDSVETYLDAAIEGFGEAISLGGLADLEEARFRRGLALALRGRAREAGDLLGRVDLTSVRPSTQGAPSGALTAPYFQARLLLASLDDSPRDAIAAGRVLRDVEKIEKLVLEFLKAAGADAHLRSKATLVLVRCIRLRAELLADPRERASLLGRARGLVMTLRARLGVDPLAAYAYLEEGRIYAASGNWSRAEQRFGSFVDETPWKDSPLAPLALLELARVRQASGKTKRVGLALSAARSRLPRSGIEGDEDGGNLRGAIEIAQAERDAVTGNLKGAADRLSSHLATGSHLVQARLLALRVRSLERNDVTRSLVAKLEKVAGKLESDDADSAADVWLELARHHAAVFELAKLGSATDRLLEMVDAADVRAIEGRCLRAFVLLREGKSAEAQREVEEAYASSIDERLDDELLLRRAACSLACGSIDDAFAQLTRLGKRRRDLGSMTRVGLAIVASSRGDEKLAASIFKSLTRGKSTDADVVPAAFRSEAGTVSLRLATAVSDAKPADRAAIWARSLLRAPFVVESIAAGINVDVTFQTDDLLEDARRLRIVPFPAEEVEVVDPFEHVSWMRILPAPVILPLLDAPPREILRIVTRSEEETP